LLGQTPGSLRPGDPADLVLFDLSPADDAPQLTVKAALSAGEIVFGKV
jgi:imidazolonepropionase-like amidohydrolase